MKIVFQLLFSITIIASLSLSAMERYGRNASNSQKERARVKKIALEREQLSQNTLLDTLKIKKVCEDKRTLEYVEKENPCPVCLEDLENNSSITLSCHDTHSFHVDCMQEWKKRSSICPYGCKYNFEHYGNILYQKEKHQKDENKLFYKIATVTLGAIALRAFEILAVTGYLP